MERLPVVMAYHLRPTERAL